MQSTEPRIAQVLTSSTTCHQDKLNASQQPRDQTASLCLPSSSRPRHLHNTSASWCLFSWLNPLPGLFFFLLYLQSPSENVSGCQDGKCSCRVGLVVPWEGGMMAVVLTPCVCLHLPGRTQTRKGHFLTSQLDLFQKPGKDNLKPTIDWAQNCIPYPSLTSSCPGGSTTTGPNTSCQQADTGSTSELQALRAKCFNATKGKLHPRVPNKGSCYLTLYFICACVEKFQLCTYV